MNRRERDLRRIIASYGLTIRSTEIRHSRHLLMELEAPNGKRDTFLFSTNNPNRVEEPQARKFARENAK